MSVAHTKQLEIQPIYSEANAFESFLFKKNLGYDERQDCINLFEYFKNGFGDAAYERFLKYIKYAGLKEERNAIVLVVPTDFIRGVIIQSYFREISSYVYNNCVSAKKIEIVVKKIEPIVQKAQNSNGLAILKQNIEQPQPHRRKIDASVCFDNFVFDDSNRLAYCSAKQVSEMILQDNCSSLPCLCIFGPVGMGKTHLMKSIVGYVKNSNQNAKIEYLSAEEFKEAYIDAVRKNDLFSFKKRFADLDALLMDDVQFICSGSGNLEKEFARVLNYLVDNRKWIVIACDRAPSSLSIDDRTKSRISSGFKASIQQSNFNLRMLILQSKIQKMYNGYDLSNSVLEYIANNIISSIRELESILHNIISYANVMNVKTIKNTLVQEIIGRCDFNNSALEVVSEPHCSGFEINFDDLLDTTCKYYGVKRNDVLGSSRIHKVSKARSVIAYITRNETAMTLKEIGDKLNRNHSTVLYLINAVSKDKSLQEEINIVIKKMK
jgi:chromosomal replication initiator protein